jgi:site-specific DNA-cytosine methylase
MKIIVFNSGVTQPADRGIYLRDIIETGETDREKSYCIDANYAKGGNEKSYLQDGRRQLIITGGAFRGRNPEKPTSRESGLDTVQMLEMRGDEKTNTLTTVQKDNVCVMIGIAGLNGHESTNRVYSPEGKSHCLTAIQGGGQEPKVSTDSITWRKLTVKECERLQTVPDGYCHAVSNSRAYHALGNGWTVDVIVHILKEGIK